MIEKYWLTPPELYEELDNEFHFDFDPCPYPKNIDSLNMTWGKMNYVNPPFKKVDGGTMPFIHKAITESKLGKSSFIVFNVRSAVNQLLRAGAIPRPMGRIKWLECKTKEPYPCPNESVGFFLKGNSSACNGNKGV
tara:strand:- start:368 stop:775 length:408 start_codon:yes stop_codon:yes gene_type:complete